MVLLNLNLLLWLSMLGKIASSVSQTIYRLGVWYSGYRLIIAVSLILIYLLTAEQLSADYDYPFLYFGLLYHH